MEEKKQKEEEMRLEDFDEPDDPQVQLLFLEVWDESRHTMH